MKNKLNKGLTFTIIFLAQSANYGESLGNVSVLKKVTRDNGEQYSYISRQALRYNIVEQLGEEKAPTTANGKGDKKVIQFSPETTIKDYPELDFFGYMKTTAKESANKRAAVVRLSNAVSLESFKGDMDFLTNAGLASRTGDFGNIAQSEIHKSYYAYTVTVDLDRIGIEENENIEIENEEKARRMKQLLKTIATLYRDIRGRRENLRPLFVIGGIYDIKNPFFENMLEVKKNKINTEKLSDAVYDFIEKDTFAGIVKGQFDNDKEIIEALKEKKIETVSVSDFFKKIKKGIEEYYLG